MITGTQHWLQIKGDPVIRGQVFQQARVDSQFDRMQDRLLARVAALILYRGVFHAMLHFSSNQLTTWTLADPFGYRVHVGDEVFADDLFDIYPVTAYAASARIPFAQVEHVLAEFRRLRFRDEAIYLRMASINCMSGVIGLNFSCDGRHYIPFDSFFVTAARF